MEQVVEAPWSIPQAVRTVEHARDVRVREIRTWNEIDNRRILAINAKFGFVRQPAWITWRKDLEE